MTTVYQRNTAYSFFLGALLMFPTIAIIVFIISTGEFYIFGAIALITVYLFMSFHFGIKFDEKKYLIITYLGYKHLYITRSVINISEITSYSKNYRKIKSSYDIVNLSYNTSSRLCKLELTLNEHQRITLVTGTEKGISEIVKILDVHLNKNNETKLEI